MRNIAESILYVASARRVMPWTTFREAFDNLCAITAGQKPFDLAGVRQTRRQIVRNLDTLGHCDFDFVGGNAHVHVAPPTLARLPYATADAVLCGARAPGTLARMSQVVAEIKPRCDVVVDEDRRHVAPARIVVRCATVEGLKRVAESLELEFSAVPSAWLLANLAPSLVEVSDRCKWRPSEEPNWPLMDFDTSVCAFRHRPAGRREPTRLTSYRDPRTKQYLTMIWADGRCAEMDREWSRYWILNQQGTQVLHYDERHFLLSVPAGAPLPRVHARALTLCAGAPPESTADRAESAAGERIHYRNVPPQVFETIREKLGQAIRPHPTGE